MSSRVNFFPVFIRTTLPFFLVCPIPSPLPQGSGRWKMNICILKEQEFVSLVEDFWKSWRLHKPSSSLHFWWDRGKEHTKSIATRFCLGKQADQKTSCSLYTALACHLKSHIDAGRISFLEVYKKVLKKISELDRFEADGGLNPLQGALGGRRARCL